MKLTVKQQKFADYYIELGNATEAAIKAGYSKKTAQQIGAENLLKPVISNYIKKRLEEMSSERIADATEVMQYLTGVMRREHKEFVPMALSKETSKWVDGKKQTVKTEEIEIIEIPARLSDSNKAAELLGKRYKLFTEKAEVEVAGAVQFIDDISGDDE
ncbi:terminase small subunit [Kurthia populi]|uniref:Terminase small subunit n=1 Tax=Kurthia populi TaxID=1562132 RepID=A0ABW5XZI5_9BACL